MKVAKGRFGRRRWAFTLVELLVVIAIIGILVSILLPAIGVVRDSARRTQNSTNLRSIGQALAVYEENKGSFPPMVEVNKTAVDSDGFPLDQFEQPRDRDYSTSWAFQLLPYLDAANIFDKHDETLKVYEGFSAGRVIGALSNKQAFATPVITYGNPRKRDGSADCMIPNAPNGERGTCIDYAANAGVIPEPNSSQRFSTKELDPQNEDFFENVFDQKGKIPIGHPLKYGPFTSGPFTLDNVKVSTASIRDGASNVIAFGDRFTPELNLNAERFDECGLAATSLWSIMRFANPSNGVPPDYNSGQIPFPHDVVSDSNPYKFGTNRGQDACFVFLDGHIKWIPYSTDKLTFALLCVIADGEPAALE